MKKIVVLAPGSNPDGVSMPYVAYSHAAALAELHDVALVIGSPHRGPCAARQGTASRDRSGQDAIFGGVTVAALCVPPANVCNWLFFSQGRGRDTLIAFSINACVMVLSFIAGLPHGPVGVAIAFSASSLLIRLPILYSILGRRGPVRTADLWTVFFRHLPVWVVTFDPSRPGLRAPWSLTCTH